MKMAVFWVLCTSLSTFQRIVQPQRPDDGGSTDFRNVSTFIPVTKALQAVNTVP
jgi:hypothetical protein